jgi:hypothetical protein
LFITGGCYDDDFNYIAPTSYYKNNTYDDYYDDHGSITLF